MYNQKDDQRNPKYPNLNELLKSDSTAREYYDSLPTYVKDQINSRGDAVNSMASLQDYSENLLRGDN
jgi:hypothetical protein